MFIVAPPVSRARRITWASQKQECGSNLTFPYFFIYFFDCSLNKRGAKGRRGERRASRSGLERHTFTAQVDAHHAHTSCDTHGKHLNKPAQRANLDIHFPSQRRRLPASRWNIINSAWQPEACACHAALALAVRVNGRGDKSRGQRERDERVN